MDVLNLVSVLDKNDIKFFTGVPDSLLSPIYNYLINNYGCNNDKHVIAHNEGGCVGLAAGYHFATGRVPCVYLQNSGIGNMTSPAVSLTHSKVYAVPVLYIVGWRGEPGKKDEPQHIYQGEVSRQQLETMGITTKILSCDTSIEELEAWLVDFEKLFKSGKSAALLVQKGAIKSDKSKEYKNDYTFSREDAIKTALSFADKDVIVSTTGKTSREIFEVREATGFGHQNDFLTVGSMGHASMIALGVAINQKDKRVWCFDGDGAMLMHMGATGIIGNIQPKNYVHIIFNNLAHESVGGAPTCAFSVDFVKIAEACNYTKAYKALNKEDFVKCLTTAKDEKGLILIEVMVAIGSRDNLGRPTTTPVENKADFMSFLKGN